MAILHYVPVCSSGHVMRAPENTTGAKLKCYLVCVVESTRAVGFAGPIKAARHSQLLDWYQGSMF